MLSGYLKNSPVSVLTVLDLRSGQRLHTWRTADIAHVTLSPDGSLLVLNEGAPDNRPGSLNEISRVITVRSAADLKVLRTWDKDLTAPVFTSTTQFAAIAPIWLDRCKPVLAGLHILPVDDASSRNWTFAPLGPGSANIAVAPEKHIVAAILLHIRTGFLARFHEDCGLTGNEIRFFNLDTDTSTVVLRDIDVVSGGNPFSSNSDILRISADATWIGLFQGGQITVRKFHHAAR